MTSTDLKGVDLKPVAAKNFAALLNRPCLRPGYRSQAIKTQSKQYSELRQRYSYWGPVRIEIQDNPGFDMINLNDDQVASIAFYFGKDSYEPLSLYLFSELAKVSDLVFDVGSYTGIYGLAAARNNTAARIFCVEPVPHISVRLQNNIELNALGNVQAVNKAVGREIGTQELKIYGVTLASSGASLVTKPRSRNVVSTLQVQVTTLTELAETDGCPLDLVKMDTEGAELDVVAGGSAVIRQDRPAIISEVLNDNAVSEQVRALSQFGYRAHFINDKDRELIPVDQNFSIQSYGYGNIIFTARPSHHLLIESAAARFQTVM